MPEVPAYHHEPYDPEAGSMDMGQGASIEENLDDAEYWAADEAPTEIFDDFEESGLGPGEDETSIDDTDLEYDTDDTDDTDVMDAATEEAPPAAPPRMRAEGEARRKIGQIVDTLVVEHGVDGAGLLLADFNRRDVDAIAVLASNVPDRDAMEELGYSGDDTRNLARRANTMLERLQAVPEIAAAMPPIFFEPEGKIARNEPDAAGELIRGFATANGRTLEQAAERAGISLSTLARLVAGSARPAAGKVAEYLRAWGVPRGQARPVLETYSDAVAQERAARRSQTEPAPTARTSETQDFIYSMGQSGVDVVSKIPPRARALRHMAGMILAGMSTDEIAAKRGITTESVYRHTRHIIDILRDAEDVVVPDTVGRPRKHLQADTSSLPGRLLERRRTLQQPRSYFTEPLGVSEATILRMEGGITAPDVPLLKAYMRMLGFSPREINRELQGYTPGNTA